MPETATERIEKALSPISQFRHNCHAASLMIVQAGLADRVARGWCQGVGSQHSWAMLGMDCYGRDATIIDPTLWSYTDREPYVWTGTLRDGMHKPHGIGSIWAWGRPDKPSGEIIELTSVKPLSGAARAFLDRLGPLDMRGWITLAHAPVEGWPAGEIFGAMEDTRELACLVPIDILGMTTERNPNGLYLRST